MSELTRCVCPRKISKNWSRKTVSQKPLKAFSVSNGVKQDGKGEKFARPILVFKKFNNQIFWALPLTLQTKKGKNARFYAPVIMEDGIDRNVILSQLRLIDKKRLLTKIGTISKTNFKAIQKAVIRLCEE